MGVLRGRLAESVTAMPAFSVVLWAQAIGLKLWPGIRAGMVSSGSAGDSEREALREGDTVPRRGIAADGGRQHQAKVEDSSRLEPALVQVAAGLDQAAEQRRISLSRLTQTLSRLIQRRHQQIGSLGDLKGFQRGFQHAQLN
jgi:hypothetical protein